MTESTSRIDAPGLAGQAYGVRVVIHADTNDLLARMVERLPPNWSPAEPTADDPRFLLTTENGLQYLLKRGNEVLTVAELEVALGLFDAQLRSYIALHAPNYIFVHAGAVGHDGRAVVIPGRSFSGKTTLVSEFVRAGATYYSDEYAVLDEQGLVHPYPKPLSMRLVEGSGVQTEQPVHAFGGVTGDEPLPIGLIISTQYRAGGTWLPQQLTSGEALLELLANTVPAQERPEQSLAVIRRALDGATALHGERGEAGEIIESLLESVRT